METLSVRDAMRRFRAPEISLRDLDPDGAAKLIAAAGDIALVVDREGVIRDLALGSEELSREGLGRWVGRAWVDTVTVESRPKVEALMRDAGGAPRWRQVNHPSGQGADLPVLYSALPLGAEGRLVAFGRDLRPVAALQQRLVEAQQSMEREYARLRHAETRYRLLFQIASEAVLIVEAASQKVVEANPAAGELLGFAANRLVGRGFLDLFEASSAAAIEALFATVRATGRGDDVQVAVNGEHRRFVIAASLFRQEAAAHFLVRLAPVQADGDAIVLPRGKGRLLTVVEGLPDGFVVTGMDRRVVMANTSFLDLAQLATEEQARGEPLDRWLGRSSIDFNVLLVSLREHGSVRQFGTVLRGEYGSTEQVEISAVAVPNGDQPCYGFTIRPIGRRPVAEAATGHKLPHSVAQLTELVGRVPLKDLVRETTDVIERLCIEAALDLTGDNRASAAEMLGLSRQSLYAKLRRYGLGDLDADTDV
jgi:transcriptional regulator PpsR